MTECEPSPDLNQSDWSQRLKEYKATREIKGFTCGSYGKESAWNAEDSGSIPGLGRSPGERNGNPLQYSCLENSMDGGTWWATVHGLAKSWTRLSDFPFPYGLFEGKHRGKLPCFKNHII